MKLCCHFLSWKSSERRNNLPVSPPPLPVHPHYDKSVYTESSTLQKELRKRNDIVVNTNTTKEGTLMKMIAKGKLTFHVI